MIDIAVVDDEIEIFDLFRIKFKNKIRSEDYRFHFFENGQECYEFVDTNDQIDIIIVFSDINMPIMDGLSLLELLKKNYPSIDVYLISAYDFDDFRDKATEVGTDGFIAKPFDFNEIEKFIEKSIEEHLSK